MADKKISALPTATTPLAGTEVLPIVQGGTTDQVSVANLTAGRDVSATGYTATNGGFTSTSGGVHRSNSAAESDSISNLFYAQNAAGTKAINLQLSSTNLGSFWAYNGSAWSEGWTVTTSGDFRLPTNNLVIGTAAKGIDFSANTHAAGMTSELLDWYEEGTFTPSFNQGFTAPVSYTSQTGKYTRIGDMVYFHAYIYMDAGQTRNTDPLALTGFPFPVASGAYVSLVWNYAAGVVAAGTALPTIYSGGVFYNTGGAAFLGTSLTSARPELAISGFYKTT